MPPRKRKASISGQSTDQPKSQKPRVSIRHALLTQESTLPKYDTVNNIKNEVLSFGSGDCSQLGLGDAENMRERKKPTLVKALSEYNVLTIAAGSLHNAVIVDGGAVLTWGCNDDHALGREDDEWLPTLVEGPLGKSHSTQKHKAAASAKQSNDEKPVEKRARRSSRKQAEPEVAEPEPVIEESPCATQVCCGASHSIALTADGDVFTWGTYRDANGVMGISAQSERAIVPTEIKLKDTCVMLAAGENHDVALTERGEVYQWGDVGFGIRFTERHRKAHKLTPSIVNFKRTAAHAGPIHIARVYAGGSSSFAVTTEGRVFSWGPNNYGQTGHGEVANVMVPTIIPDLPPIASIAAAIHHSVFLTRDGRVYTVGKNEDGRLGLGHTNNTNTITEIQGLPRITQIAAGEAHTLLVTEQGQLFTFGYGDLLQLGNGEEEDINTPTKVDSQQLDKEQRIVIQAAGGSQHSLILARKSESAAPAAAPVAATS